MILKHIYEVCGKTEILDSEEAYLKGWDYPPKMGMFKLLYLRTCENCSIEKTVFWKVVALKIPFVELSEKDWIIIFRIGNEPESILP